MHHILIVDDHPLYREGMVSALRAQMADVEVLGANSDEVLRLLGEGYTNKEIARTLDITERTAKAHVAAIFEALAGDNRTQAVLKAQRLGYLRPIASGP